MACDVASVSGFMLLPDRNSEIQNLTSPHSLRACNAGSPEHETKTEPPLPKSSAGATFRGSRSAAAATDSRAATARDIPETGLSFYLVSCSFQKLIANLLSAPCNSSCMALGILYERVCKVGLADSTSSSQIFSALRTQMLPCQDSAAESRQRRENTLTSKTVLLLLLMVMANRRGEHNGSA